MQPTAPAAWLPPPRPRDIVLAYFPYTEDHGRPSNDVHPCVVLSVGIMPDQTFRLLVAYGSSKGLLTAGKTNVIVDPANVPGTGLSVPTRFQLSRRAWLPFNPIYFMQANGNRTPLIGRLPDEAMAEFERAKQVVLDRKGANWLRPDLEPL